ncbi:ABC transporter substrate-binding protein [Pseudonocardia sp.]|jgi:peptide/nickel transport system substrate-binding protein|uniref:ABC transporter substrate-binding protein n=1 Tax=Pseudonocardia sp. TaxID=60912 RepID=UPI0026263EDB|nr:ABC transporter substrate-binding protein [Pseudonocardia sp.]MCW2721002.1 ABC-type transporter, periplasmic subunit [Pseudonocardia sp.]
MRSRRRVAVVALGAVAALVLAACGGGSSSSSGSSSDVNGVHNPSDVTGGTLRYANSGDWDSLDPADTYYAYSWNFARLYGRSLVMFKSAPGAQGTTLVPDLAQTLGVPSDNAKTWTYKLRPGVKFEDGTPVTSRDVKYAVERSLDKTTFPNGPTYFNDFLDLQGYTSPYSDPDPNKLGLKAIETPDDQTIIFHLKTPFSGFDYFAQLPATMPVPIAKDTGTKYKEHVVSTGPYMFKTNDLGKSFTMVRNPNWSQATDPNRKPLPDEIDVALNVNADDIDNRLLSGDLDVAIEGSGLGPAAQGKVLADQTLKANTDDAAVARLWYANINSDVAPLNNIHCRMAIEYAADKTGYQRSYGGSSGGDIASNLLPPLIPGAEKFDDYATPNSAGDVAKAKDQLAQCGQPNGFSTSISYRAERPKEKATAESLQQSLAKAGINLTIKPYPLGDYFKLYAGKPDFAKANGLGMMITGWGADWPDGYGFLDQIVDSRVIRASGGNTNLGVKDPAVDAMIDKALQTTDTAAREQIWVDIDKKVMSDAFILPGIWSKSLLYRPPNLTNAFVTNGFQMYDYLALGTTRK